jgi:secreted trypsin-like serine protease
MRLRPPVLAASALAASVLVAGGLAAAPATASTGGTPDYANTYDNVAFILAYSEDGNRYRCSATLVDEDTLLTAAHCTDGVVGKQLVSFDPTIVDSPTPPETSPFPAAADPEAGYTQAELEAAGYYSGDSVSHPDYSDFTDLDSWNDVGVVELDQTVTGIEPAPIAELGTLSAIKKSDLAKTRFTAVGYGTEFRKPDEGPQKKQPMTYPLIRRYVEMTGQKLTPQILQTHSSVNKNKGTGGTCFGDSGGPVFLDGEVVAVTSYGLNDNCGNISGYQRVDIEVVQDWLADFGVTAG